MTTELQDLLAEKVTTFRREIEELGLASSFFWRAPGSAKAPVLHLLIGETSIDVEEARKGDR